MTKAEARAFAAIERAHARAADAAQTLTNATTDLRRIAREHPELFTVADEATTAAMRLVEALALYPIRDLGG